MEKRTKMATILALVMHAAGLAGLFLGFNGAFEKLTPFNLLMMFILLVITRPKGNDVKLAIFLAFTFFAGFAAEMTGVHTGILFGNYHYGSALGPKVNEVPLLIGMNWFIVVYASGMLAMQLRNVLGRWIPARAAYSRWFGFSVVVDGALLATLFDLIMEPAATKLGLWTWAGGQIPALNYICWFGLSLVMLTMFRAFKFRQHPFAVNLLLIQAMFFLLIGLR